MAQRAIVVGAIIFIAEWVAAWTRGGLPSVGAAGLIEATLLSLACSVVGAAAVGLVVHLARLALRALGDNTERWLVGAGVCAAAGLAIMLETIAVCQRLGVPVYGRYGLAAPWQPGLVMALLLGALAIGLAALGYRRGKGRLVTILTAAVWLHLAIGPAYLDMAARVTPRRHLFLVIVCLAVLDVAVEAVRSTTSRESSRVVWWLAIAAAGVAWVAAPFAASHDARLIVGGRMSVPYRVLAVGVGAPWSPKPWKPATTQPIDARSLLGASAARPSKGVVLVLIDTLRADALGWEDGDEPLAPNLRRARQDSMRWSRAYATYPGTGPSSEAMLGRATSPTLLDSLHAADVHSVAVTASGPLLAPDFDEVDASAKPAEMTHRMHRYADRVTSAASKQLDRLMAEAQPFLLLVHYMAPHAPYVGSGSRFASARDRYRDEVAYVDIELEPLLARLGEHVAAGELTVFVVSDHGEEFLEHGYGTHGVRLYDESMRVVLFAAGPGIEPGESSDPVSGADLAPTLAGLFDVGASDAAADLPSPSDENARVITMRGANSFGCVRDPIKWIHDTETGCWERYDLASDPNELHNGADEHEVPAWCATRGG